MESWDVTNAWLGFTDKYWATVLVPNTDATKVKDALLRRRSRPAQQTLSDRLSGAGADHRAGRKRFHRCARLFAGAKEVSVVGLWLPPGPGGYNQSLLHLNHFDLLIDLGLVPISLPTKPMFLALDYFFHLVGNFGIAILIVTVLVILFFPLANKSLCASMAKMKAVQPEMAMIKQRYGDDFDG